MLLMMHLSLLSTELLLLKRRLPRESLLPRMPLPKELKP